MNGNSKYKIFKNESDKKSYYKNATKFANGNFTYRQCNSVPVDIFIILGTGLISD